MTTIIVAEDEPLLAQLMKQELEAAGYSVRSAAHGKEVLALLGQEGSSLPDVILSDLLMPEMTGYELLEVLKADDRYKHIPCLVLSNSGQIDDLNRAFKLGAVDVLIKTNFNPEQLVGKVQTVLATKTSSPQ